ncbi:MAG TPA: SDR family NAD(P)-dependent oxidoreductase, partial [Pirellulaceae bacterium]|nr:SDR family NAD(P)-dependent oxidoreductase [Pirellulaceae bacterium]
LRVLTLRGAHVFGTGRTLEKAAAACAAAGDRATPLALELTDFDSVVACAEAVRRAGVAIDMLVCNAGIMALPTLEQVASLDLGTLGPLWLRDAGREFLPLSVAVLVAVWSVRLDKLAPTNWIRRRSKPSARRSRCCKSLSSQMAWTMKPDKPSCAWGREPCPR